MKKLVIIRHGKSSWEDPYLSDKERPLLGKGIKRTEKIGTYLQSQNIIPDIMISSPARRAHETAEIIAPIVNYNIGEILINPTFYFEGSRRIHQEIKKFEDNWNTVFIFGHNPDFTTLVNIFSQERLYHLPTTGTAIFNFKTDKWAEVNSENCVSDDFIFPSNL